MHNFVINLSWQPDDENYYIISSKTCHGDLKTSKIILNDVMTSKWPQDDVGVLDISGAQKLFKEGTSSIQCW